MTLTLSQVVRTACRPLSLALALAATVSVGANFVACAPAHAERRLVRDDTTYIIKRVYKAGETDRYRLITKMKVDSPQTGEPVDAVSTMVMKETTREVKADGASISISEFESASVKASGNDLDFTTMMPKVITTRDKNGKSDVKMEGGNEQVTAQIGDQIKQFTVSSAAAYLPAKPIKIGDTWNIDPSTMAGKGQKVKGKVTLVSVDRVNGVQIAKLKTITDITGEMKTKIHSEATTLVDVATGKPLNVVTKTEGETNGGKLNIEMDLKMLGPDDKVETKEPVKADGAVKKP